MTEPIAIEPVIQKSLGDCAVACLAMLLGVPYVAILSVIPPRYYKDIHKGVGLSQRQMTNATRRLGIGTRWIEKADYSDTIGILDLHRKSKGKWEGHVVMLINGVIFNPGDGLLWTDMATFFKTTRWQPRGVMVRTE